MQALKHERFILKRKEKKRKALFYCSRPIRGLLQDTVVFEIPSPGPEATTQARVDKITTPKNNMKLKTVNRITNINLKHFETLMSNKIK